MLLQAGLTNYECLVATCVAYFTIHLTFLFEHFNFLFQWFYLILLLAHHFLKVLNNNLTARTSHALAQAWYFLFAVFAAYISILVLIRRCERWRLWSFSDDWIAFYISMLFSLCLNLILAFYPAFIKVSKQILLFYICITLQTFEFPKLAFEVLCWVNKFIEGKCWTTFGTELTLERQAHK